MLQPMSQPMTEPAAPQAFRLPDLELIGDQARGHGCPSGSAERAGTGTRRSAREAGPPKASALPAHRAEAGEGRSVETMYELAQSMLADGQWRPAQLLLERLRDTIAPRVAADDPAMARVAGLLSLSYLFGSQFALAEKCALRALAIYQQRAGMELEVAKTYNNLAAIYNSQKRFEVGESYLRRAFSTMETLAESRPEAVDETDLLPILDNFCRLLKLTGRQAEALLLEARMRGGDEDARSDQS